MRKFYYLILVALLAVSCSTMNRAEKYVNSGNYDEAFDLLLRKYQKGLSDKQYGKYLPTFQKAYLRMVEDEEDKIERLKLDNTPANYGEMYRILTQLDERQSKLKALLPIVYKGKTYLFPTKNYAPAIAQIKQRYIDYLVLQGDALLNRNNTNDARTAYSYFSKVKQLNAAYPHISERLNDAHYAGTTFVLVELNNKSNQLIPRSLERELTDVRTYDVDDFWTQFHNKAEKDFTYDYLVQLNFNRIMVSPERQNVVIHNFEKQIVDGWTYLHQNGHQVVDSLGEPIKVDKLITVRGRLEEVILEKDAYMEGNVHIIDMNSNRALNQDRLYSELAFRDRFARYDGDPRAIDTNFRDLIQRRPIGFPTNEQMVYDCGEDIKKKLKRILRRTF